MLKPFKNINEVFGCAFIPKEANFEYAQEILAGVYAFGHSEVERLLEDAFNQNKLLRFYYASQKDLMCDVLSFRLEDIQE